MAWYRAAMVAFLIHLIVLVLFTFTCKGTKDTYKIDLIFLDINMPKMNGWEFIEEFKKIDPIKRRKIVVVILSTSINPDDYNRAQDSAEISDFETKPLDADAIENIIYKFF